MRQLHIFPIEAQDVAEVERWADAHPHAAFDLPHGFEGPSTLGLVAEANGRLLAAMVGSVGITIDVIKNPNAPPLALAEAVQRLEENITVHAAVNGAVDSYISVPNVPEMEEFHRTVQRRGYVPTAQGCTIYRRSIIRENSKSKVASVVGN